MRCVSRKGRRQTVQNRMKPDRNEDAGQIKLSKNLEMEEISIHAEGKEKSNEGAGHDSE